MQRRWFGCHGSAHLDACVATSRPDRWVSLATPPTNCPIWRKKERKKKKSLVVGVVKWMSSGASIMTLKLVHLRWAALYDVTRGTDWTQHPHTVTAAAVTLSDDTCFVSSTFYFFIITVVFVGGQDRRGGNKYQSRKPAALWWKTIIKWRKMWEKNVSELGVGGAVRKHSNIHKYYKY